MPPVLDLREEQLARLLERAGLSRGAARVFVALARGGGHAARSLSEATALARQDVGEAARELESRGLARIERVASGGRPSHRYHLAREPADAVRALAADRRKEIEGELAALDALVASFS